MRLAKSCIKLERDKRVLLFNPKNLEIVVMTSDKFYSRLGSSELSELNNCGMLDNEKVAGYDLKEVFPEHITKVYLLFGTDCNISCKYCTVKHNARNYPFQDTMTDETLNNSLKFLFEKNEGISHITLYGGEPMLHRERINQFFDYVESLPVERVPRIDLITNGILTDLELMERMKKWNVLVLISLDGTKQEHDIFRVDGNGKGTYERVVEGIKAYQKAGLRVGISMVLGKHNCRNIRNICTELKRTYNIISIGLTLPHMEPDIAIDDEFNDFLKYDYKEVLDACQEQGLWFEQGMKRLLSLAEKKYYIYGCPVDSKGCMIRILPDGVVTLCENMGLREMYQLGNVNESDIQISHMMETQQFQQWYRRCTKDYSDCMECSAYGICGMGCPYDAYLQHGTINAIEQRCCYISKQAVSWYLERAIQMADISDENCIKVLDISERKRILVDCPWEKK